MRQEYSQFEERESEVVSVGSEDAEAFRNYWDENELPFPGIPDPEQKILKLYRQEVSALRLGRMPAMFVIDMQGKIRFAHYAQSMSDIPKIDAVIAVLDSIRDES